MKAIEFLEKLESRGFNFFAAVPDTILKGLIAILEKRGERYYLPAVREDDALGAACGAYMAGKQPVVLMQNSGLGTCLNVLTSLHLIYKIPCLLVVSWRGFGGVDAPEHLVMGKVCTDLLTLIGIPHRVLDPSRLDEDLSWALEVMKSEKRPVALMLKKGVLA